MPVPAATARLILRELDDGDAAFILALLNDPDFLRHIGDRQVRDLDGARRYINDGPRTGYARDGHGLWCVERRDDGERIGICGLIRRDTLPAPDLGYAYLPAFRGQGYAREAAQACLRHAFDVLAMPRVLAIVSEGNAASFRLLAAIGFEDRGLQAVDGTPLRVLEARR